VNVYYNPEHFGLEIADEFHRPDLWYEFDMVVVFRRIEDGKLFWGADSGCSCPLPFERFTSIESLSPLPETERSFQLAKDALFSVS